MESEVAWASGLIEGEGCFTLVKNDKARLGKTAKIVVQMNDLDILQRLYSIFNVGKIYSRPARSNSKASWSWTVYRADDVKYVIIKTLPYLGKRRAEKANELLEWINAVK